ncbi:MAG TPA: hypothetical protein VGX03_18405 [Candidatus Binatia bacterium]|jgi:hypothetical protein|nr:hypothetical protein [Candidatus Binatia bacterium]
MTRTTKQEPVFVARDLTKIYRMGEVEVPALLDVRTEQELKECLGAAEATKQRAHAALERFALVMKRERREAGISGAFPAETSTLGTARGLIPAYG